jgi:hypothetical protein
MELRSGLQLKNRQASRRVVGGEACHYLRHPRDHHQAIQDHRALVQDLKARHLILTRVVSFQDHLLHRHEDRDKPLWVQFHPHPKDGRTSHLGRGPDRRRRVPFTSTLVPRQFVHMSEVHHHLKPEVSQYRQDQQSQRRDQAVHCPGPLDVR